MRLTAMIALLTLGLPGCGFLSNGSTRKPDELELQYRALAGSIGSIKPCLLISPKSLRSMTFGPRGTRHYWLRSSCFYEVAVNSVDPSICDRVVPVPPSIEQGSFINPEHCRQSASVGSMHFGSSLNQNLLMKEMGYSQEEIDSMPKFPFNPVIHTEEFFNRIDQLPNFAGPESAAEMKTIAWHPPKDQTSPNDCPGGACFIVGKETENEERAD